MEEKTINQVFRNRTKKYGDRLAIEKKLNGKWESATWNEYYERARAAGLALHSMGVSRGDRIIILSENRLEWLYSDMGALGIGACVVPIYPTLTDEEAEYIVGNSDAKVMIVENTVQLKKALYAKERCAGLTHIIVMKNEDSANTPDYVLSYKEFLDIGRREFEKSPTLFETLADQVELEDYATFVYTSGTTGVPKGAMITHNNVISVIKALDAVEPHYAYDTDQTVPFLPLSHVFERVAGHWYGMYVGITSSYAESIDSLLSDLAEKRPTVVLAVPRVCEKVYQKIIAKVEEASPFKQKVFYWGQKVGSRISEFREARKRIPLLLRIKYKIAYKMIFANVQNALGGRVRWMTASGAPTAKEIIQFFNAAGIMVISGYGMTETCAPATMQNISHYRIGTTGAPIPCTEIKIADDGEILMKGGNVCKGYWKMPEETKEAFTEDGYLMSGDIGYFDEDGFLLITDRKKDLIITSGGKNVAPQKIENLYKADPLFTQFIVIGDQKKYLTALCNINPDQAVKIAQEKNISYTSLAELMANEAFLKVLQEHIDERNTNLARYETIKQVKIVDHEFSQETGELTPSLKVKRNVVKQKYKDLIDSMYEDEIKVK
ncbi:MAG: long-chain fatty acid--CoA ligase [Spirochaetae bacterium HGW-Spirochaetae-1]|jgi:long-chain acyl-CoA synthetase|nr:MAG: long-chain fatty acid--CoA ligase [Spirochaetae bacterium HGW-Spirochaetae-1]